MKIGFFTQNVRRGGLDTFLINLLNSWRVTDDLVLFCNRSHPGLVDLKRELSARVEIVEYDFLTAQDLHDHMVSYAKPVRSFVKGLFWVLGFPYLVHSARHVMMRYPCERLLIVNGGYPGGDACLAAAVAWARSGKPKAWHNVHNQTMPYPSNLMRRMKECWIDKRVARSVAGFVAVSASCLQTLEKRSVLLGAKDRFIHNGMPPPNEPLSGVPLRLELGLPETAELILMLAVYEPRKGHSFMFEAMQALAKRRSQAYLLVCGDGSPAEYARVLALRDQSPCRDRILLRGHRTDVAFLLTQVQILAVPSQAYESFGYMALEAMNKGLPVVCTDVGGLPEVVENERTGFVISKDDVTGFAEALELLLAQPIKRRVMGAAGKARADELFSVESMTDQYITLLK